MKEENAVDDRVVVPRARVIVCTCKDSFRNFNLCLKSPGRDPRSRTVRPDGRTEPVWTRWSTADVRQSIGDDEMCIPELLLKIFSERILFCQLISLSFIEFLAFLLVKYTYVLIIAKR